MPTRKCALALGVMLTACQPPAPTDGELQKHIDQLVFVEGGTFMMGVPDEGIPGKKNHKEFHHWGHEYTQPAHPVTLTSYSIQAYEVTFAEFDQFSKENGMEIVRPERRHISNAQPNNAAKWMTWFEARDYCRWLGGRIGYPMDLPTEAQWEYAARSRGKTVLFATDNGEWHHGINMRDPVVYSSDVPVGSWPPNPLGLYDMTGNVGEWTSETMWRYKNSGTTLIDPEKTSDNEDLVRMERGGGTTGTVTVYHRMKRDPSERTSIGLRCVVNHPKPITAPRTTKDE